MAYADFAFYQGEYLGKLFRSADDYNTPAERAAEYLDAVTFGRLLDGVPDEFSARVQRCCCALAEAIAEYQAYGTASSDDGRAKASETTGKYSVSYASPAESLQALLDGNTSGLEDYLKSICMRYLGATGLLYRGCY